MESERTVKVDPDHPSLAGHFPGHPVVPGVVMLGEVMEAIRMSVARNIQFVGMPTAKFVSPLLPGEALTIKLDEASQGIMVFTCSVGARVVASGSFAFRILPAASRGDV